MDGMVLPSVIAVYAEERRLKRAIIPLMVFVQICMHLLGNTTAGVFGKDILLILISIAKNLK